MAKNFVAALHTGDRSMAQLRGHLLLGLYGDAKNAHAGVTAASCTAAADHMEREIERWMLASERIRALFPGRANPNSMTIAGLTAHRRALYGPLVRPHRRGARTNDESDPVDGVDNGDEDLAVAPHARPASAAASATRL